MDVGGWKVVHAPPVQDRTRMAALPPKNRDWNTIKSIEWFLDFPLWASEESSASFQMRSFACRRVLDRRFS